MFFWSLVTITYLWILQVFVSIGFSRFHRIGAGVIGTAIVTAAVSFKLAFTHEDSPELMPNIIKSFGSNDVGVSLVTRARITFMAILVVLAYTLGSSFSYKKPNRERSYLKAQNHH